MNKHTGLAALSGWRRWVADWVVPPVARRSSIDEETLRAAVGFAGRLRYNAERPDGTPRKLLDTSRLDGLGWRPRIPLERGLADAYRWYRERVVPAAA